MATPVQFQWDPPRAAAVNADFASCTPGRPWAFQPNDLAQGLMQTLFAAEMMAAQAGIVPFVTLGNGQKGVVSIGGARDYVSEMTPEMRTIYLAAHGSVRQANAGVSSRTPGTPYGSQPIDSHVIEVPLLVPLVCLGVAAIIATAGYLAYTKGKEIETEGGNLRTANLAAKWAATAQAAIASGIKPPDSFWSGLGELDPAAKKEASSAWWTPLAIVGGVTIVTVGALTVFQNRALLRRAFR